MIYPCKLKAAREERCDILQLLARDNTRSAFVKDMMVITVCCIEENEAWMTTTELPT